MRTLVAGASGFVGRALVDRLRSHGVEVHRIVRTDPEGTDAHYDQHTGTLDCSRLPEGSLGSIDAVYCVGGVPLSPRRWGPEKRAAVYESRVTFVDVVARAIAATDDPPATFVTMSAIGIYGNRGDEELTEESAAGEGYLADLCRAWEHAAAPARTVGTRTVHGRAGIVIGPGGGFVERLLPIFKLGLGGRLGSGRQWMSWIALDDISAALADFAQNGAFAGPVNLVAPHPVRNRDFTKVFASALHRPVLSRVPTLALRAAAGRRVTDEFLLQSARVIPAKLVSEGFHFAYPTIDSAIAASLSGGRTK